MKSNSLILATIVAIVGFQSQTRATDLIFTTIRPPLAPPTGVVTDRFAVGTDLQGLTYADQDVLYGPTLFYSIRNDIAGNSTFTSISSLTSTTAPRFSVGNHAFDALTFAAPDVGYGPTIFYSLSHDLAGNSTFGTMQPTGVPYTALFGVAQNSDALTFAATDVGYGANLFYYLSHDTFGNSTFGSINPTPGGIVSPLFTVGLNFDELVFTSTDVGYGADMFYYLRTDTNGDSIFGTIDGNADFSGTRVVDRFALGAPFEELTFTTTDVGYGPNLFYSLRNGESGSNGGGDGGGSGGNPGGVPEPGALLPMAIFALLFAWRCHSTAKRRAQSLRLVTQSVTLPPSR